MQNKREWIIFIPQSILNTAVFLRTTSPRSFSRFQDDANSQGEKIC